MDTMLMQYLRMERCARKLNQPQAAGEVGVALATYRGWEQGRTPTMQSANAISQWSRLSLKRIQQMSEHRPAATLRDLVRFMKDGPR